MATNTYVALDKVTISGTSTSTVTFSSIPSTYTDLIIVGNLGSESTNAFPYLQFNGDTGSNYSYTELYANGSNAYSVRVSNNTQLFNNDVSVKQGSVNSNVIYHIMNYSNTTTYKTSLTRQNTVDAADYNGALVATGLWRNTAAITSVSIKLTRGGTAYNFSSGSTFSLYGIKAWTAESTPKATGGYVTSDSTYWYHALPFSSTFVPSQALTADILVIAGGASAANGGGGAGGLREIASRALSSGVTYTATIGAGAAGYVGNSEGTSGTASSLSGSGFTTISASGGGGGGGTAYGGAGFTGGSGGGGSGRLGSPTQAGSAGNSGGYTPVEGYAGGSGYRYSANANEPGGGGGGAGGVGGNASSTNGKPGDGGVGATSSLINAIGAATGYGQFISGNYYFAGGGAGGNWTNALAIQALGGYGGGGNSGTTSSRAGASGIVSTGGGGGGSSGVEDIRSGAGGSGLVVIRYAK